MRRRYGYAIIAGIFLQAAAGITTLYAQQTEQVKATTAAPNNTAKADELYFDAVNEKNKGNNKKAEELFRMFTTLRPNEPAAYYELSRIAADAKRLDSADIYIQKAIALDQTDNKWYQEQYAFVLVGRNRAEEAADIFMKLAAKEKYNDDYLLKASRLYQRVGKYAQSLSAIDKLIAQDPDDDDLLLQKQQIYLAQNNLEGAIKISETLIEKNPRESRYYALLGELYDNNNHPKQAEEVYEKAEKQFPSDAIIQLSLAAHYRKIKNENKYNEYVEKAIVNNELDAETQVSLLLPYLEETNTDTATRATGLLMTEKVAKQHQNNALVLAFYGDVLSLNSRPAEAAEQYKKAVAIDPSKFETWQHLMYSYTSDKAQADSLIKYSEKSIKLFPNQAIAHYLNGLGYYNKKEYNKAVKAIDRAIDLQPEDNPALLAEMNSMAGDIYNLLKVYDKSDERYNTALKLNPDNPSVLNNYSYYLSVRGIRLSEAEQMIKRALELRKGEPTFMDTYGWILYKEGKYDKAKELIQQAINAGGADADGTLYEHLGDVYYKLNDISKAVELWQKAREKGTDSEYLDKKIKDKKLYE